jgi:hypothetical protein
VFVVGCTNSSQKSILVTEASIAPQPTRVGPITVNFKLANASTPLTGAHVSLEGDMTHAGMAPVFGDAKEISPGQYQGRLTLNMGGDWVVLLHITLPGGRKVERQINVSGVQNG